MDYKIFEKLLEGGIIADVAELSSDEKRLIYDTMREYGMSDGTTWNRFYRDGFKPWELRGVRNIMAEFVKEQRLDPALLLEPKLFIGQLPVKRQFHKKMESYGMCATTTDYRFKGWNFKPWEEAGIRRIVNKHFIDPLV